MIGGNVMDVMVLAMGSVGNILVGVDLGMNVIVPCYGCGGP